MKLCALLVLLGQGESYTYTKHANYRPKGGGNGGLRGGINELMTKALQWR